jgi:hypothetical protein
MEMTNQIVDVPQRKTVKVAGIMFLLSLFVPSLNWTFVQSKFIAGENAIVTAQNILANEFLYRIGIVNDLITSAIAVVLALVLYVMLKSINKNLALFALLLKLMEAILLAVIALSSYFALLILQGQASLIVSEPEQIQILVGLFVIGRMSVSAIPMVFLGLNLVVFLYLLLKSRYVPSLLAGFGILSYALIFIYAVLTILLPSCAAISIIQILCWAPSCVFELIIGIWLLTKGVKISSQMSTRTL